LNNGVNNAYSVVVGIDTPPSGIDAVQNASGAYIDAGHPAHQGDLLIVGLSNFAPAGTSVSLDRVQIVVGGAVHSPLQVTSVGDGHYQVGFLLGPTEAVGTTQPLIVYLDGRSSLPVAIPVAHPDGSFAPQPETPTDPSGN
jgi:hypothetical protein